MRYEKLGARRKTKRLRQMRNHLVCELLSKDKYLTVEKAQKLAHKMLGIRGKFS